MGLITDLIDRKHNQQRQKAADLRGILSSPDLNLSDDTKTHIAEQLLELSGLDGGGKGGKGKGGEPHPFVEIIKHITGQGGRKQQPQGGGEGPNEGSGEGPSGGSKPSSMAGQKQSPIKTTEQMQNEAAGGVAQQEQIRALFQRQITAEKNKADLQLQANKNLQIKEEADRLNKQDPSISPSQAYELAKSGRIQYPPIPKPTVEKKETANDIAFKKYREKHHLPEGQSLTGQQEVEAIKDYKESTAVTKKPKTDNLFGGDGSGGARIKQIAANNPALDYDAWTYMLTRKFNVRGIGKGATEGAEKIKARASQIMSDLGLTAADLFGRGAELTGKLGSYSKISQYSAMVDAFEKTLQKNVVVAKKLSSDFKRGDIRLYNRVLSAFKTGKGDPQALNLAAQLHGVSREWGKIMAGSVSALGVPISEANATDEFFGRGLSNGQLDSLIENVILPDAANRKSANEEEKEKLKNEIKGLAGGGGPKPQSEQPDLIRENDSGQRVKYNYKTQKWEPYSGSK